MGGRSFGSEGDAQSLVFSEAGAAVRRGAGGAARARRARLARGQPVRVRMGIHSGEVPPARGRLRRPRAPRDGRVTAAGHGGQVLLSAATAALVRRACPPASAWRDLGEHRLKDLAAAGAHLPARPAMGLRRTFPPLRTLEAVGARLPIQVTSLRRPRGGRAASRDLLAGTRLLTLTGPAAPARRGSPSRSPPTSHRASRTGRSSSRSTPSPTPPLVASEIATRARSGRRLREPIDRVVGVPAPTGARSSCSTTWSRSSRRATGLAAPARTARACRSS